MREDAGIGTQNVEPTVPIDGRRRHRLHVGKLRDISRKRADGGALRAQLLRGGLGILQMAGDDEHLRAVASEHPCYPLADALAATSDDDRCAFQGCRHRVSPFEIYLRVPKP